MNKQSNPSLKKSIALGALLLLAATASGCGVGLPTQPDIDSGVASQRLAGTAASLEPGSRQDVSDNSTGGSGSGEILPAGEIVVQSPSRYDSFKGAGKAIGHQKNKWSARH